jgi:molybdate transport system substrate-binding protein
LADIRVMTGGAPKEVLGVLIPQFEPKTGHKVHLTFAVISAIQQKLDAGETPDMVLMPVPAIEARVKAGTFRGDARAALGTSAPCASRSWYARARPSRTSPRSMLSRARC